jgi:hypothetical protein
MRYGRETVPERVRVQREGAQLQAQGTWSAGEGDDKQRFLADLRALRDMAALEFDELAARAHYPSGVLKEAENGPTLPTLPILAAYVRACDGDVLEWEERWRRIGVVSRAGDGLPVRPAGASPAAVAGARAGVSVAPPDAYDPERIRAALRGSQGRSDHDGHGAATRVAPGHIEPVTPAPAAAEPRVPESPASWSGGTSWDETTRWDAGRSAGTAAGWGADAEGWGSGFQRDSGFQQDASERWDGAAADLNGASGNGNHHLSQPGGMSSDAAVIETPDAARADAIRRDPFSAAWLQDSELTPPPDLESGWPDQAGAEPPAAGDSWFTPRETADGEPARPAADAEPPAAADSWFTPHDRADGSPALPQPAERDVAPPQERIAEPIVTGFWTPSAATPAPAEAQRPGPAPAEDHTAPRASWPAAAEAPASDPARASWPAETPASEPPAVADRTTPARAQAAAATPSRTIAEPVVPPGPVVPAGKPRSDRLYLVRLLVVIVAAALIGSILVLLVR